MTQGKSMVVPVVIAILATALVVGGIFMFLDRAEPKPDDSGDNLNARIKQLESKNEELLKEKESLQKTVTDLETKVEKLQTPANKSSGLVINRQPKSGWQQYFPTPETTTLVGKNTDYIRQLLGEPPFLIRSIAVNPEFSREIWVYTTDGGDSTGLYLFFKGGLLNSSRLDEFNGLYGSDLLNLDDFWLQ